MNRNMRDMYGGGMNVKCGLYGGGIKKSVSVKPKWYGIQQRFYVVSLIINCTTALNLSTSLIIHILWVV